MGQVTRCRRANLLSALGLVAVLAGLAYGLPAIDRALPADRPVRTDQAYLIGGGIHVMPPRGAVLDVTGTRPSDDAGTVLFRLGPVRYSITVRPFAGTLDAAVMSLRRRITDTLGYQVTGTQLAVATAGGLTGVQGGYSGPGQGGRYAVFVAAGRTIEVTVSGADLDAGSSLAAIDASMRTLGSS